MNLIKSLKKPEYVFRPLQIYRRLKLNWARKSGQFEDVILPWGLSITIRPDETIGRLIRTMGVFELCVTEALWRLIDPGEIVVDVGGNIGYMTSLMAVRVGHDGHVMVFEPHPEVFKELSDNLDGWRKRKGINWVTAHQVALADYSGTGLLGVADSFLGNRGLARIVSSAQDEFIVVGVRVERLHDLIDDHARIGVLKVDVEGQELSVLKGAGELLKGGRIRDIVFEERNSYPTDVTQFLMDHGYTILSLRQRFRGPVLGLPNDVLLPLRDWDTQNFLATLDPLRARGRFSKSKGWHSLQASTF